MNSPNHHNSSDSAESSRHAVERDRAMVEIAKFAPAPSVHISDGAHALAGGLLYLERTRSIVAADIHLGYEEVIGGALPLWSIGESMVHLQTAVQRCGAREIIMLGDVVHGARMSSGAARQVMQTLQALREICTLTIITGNHEGLSRAAEILGDTHEVLERDGWMLVHGDEMLTGRRCMIGHLHPSVHLGGGKTAPAFLASPSLIVVPALTPYSPGLNICSAAGRAALKPWIPEGEDLTVYGVAGRMVYPFGSLAALTEAMQTSRPRGIQRRNRFRRR